MSKQVIRLNRSWVRISKGGEFLKIRLIGDNVIRRHAATLTESSLEDAIEVTIDLDGIAKQFGTRATENHSRSARGLRGLISAHVVSRELLRSVSEPNPIPSGYEVVK